MFDRYVFFGVQSYRTSGGGPGCNLDFVFLVIFYGLGSHGIYHHETPPCGRIFLGTFPSSKHRRFANPSYLEQVVALENRPSPTKESTRMSQEVSKWLVNGLYPTYKGGILGL